MDIFTTSGEGTISERQPKIMNHMFMKIDHLIISKLKTEVV